MNYNNIPSEHRKDITYYCIVVDYHPQKEQPNHNILSVVENIIEYPGDVIKPTIDTNTANIVWNSVVSNPNTKYM